MTTTINGVEWEWQPDMASWTNDAGEAISQQEMETRQQPIHIPQTDNVDDAFWAGYDQGTNAAKERLEQAEALLNRILNAGYRYTESDQMYTDIRAFLSTKAEGK